MEGADGIPNIDLAQDAFGNVYITGVTRSIDFPVSPGALQDSICGEDDIFIVKFDRNLTTMLAATLLGGSLVEKCPKIRIDQSGDVFVVGATNSPDYPTTPGAVRAALSGDRDLCVSKLDSDLTTLLGSTYLGGGGTEEFGFDMVIDQAGNIFVAGYTPDAGFPTTGGAYNETYNGGSSDFFVSKFNSTLTSLAASTFLGGSYQEEHSVDIDVDGDGNIILFGCTGSADFPFISPAYDTSFNGPYSHGPYDLDLCLAKLDNDLATLIASTFFGGSGFERAYCMTHDPKGDIYITGHTASLDFPITPGAFDGGHNGIDETFVSKLDGDLANLLGSTYFTPDDGGGGYFIGMRADRECNLWLAGGTRYADFPVTDDAMYPSYTGGEADAVLVKLSKNCGALLYSTFLGGGERDLDAALTFSTDNIVYFAGYTKSSDFPALGDGYDHSYDGEQDAYVARFSFNQFSAVSEGPHVSDTGCGLGVNWTDYDQDGDADIFVTNFRYDPRLLNFLYENVGDGNFVKHPADSPLLSDREDSRGASWADYDNDGYPDVYAANFMKSTKSLYRNLGNQLFVKANAGSMLVDGHDSFDASWVDYDGDGDLDLYVVNEDGSVPPPGLEANYLYRNDDGDFVKVTEGIIATDLAPSQFSTWCDYDNDGDPDLFVVNCPNYNNILYRNEGGGEFVRFTGDDIVQDGSESIGASWGDYDNDGDFDVFVVTMSYVSNGANLLYRNNGDGTFTKRDDFPPAADTGNSRGSAWCDYDNDGDLDLFVSQQGYNLFYKNVGAGGFIRVGNAEPMLVDSSRSCGIAWCDFDRDRDMDLYETKCDNGGSCNALCVNTGNTNNWLTVKPAGTSSNRDGIGAKVKVRAIIYGALIWQVREIRSKTGRYSHGLHEAQFGLGDAPLVDSIIVEWPRGMVDIMTHVTVNQFLTITETRRGDANGDGNINVGDANCDGVVDVADAVYLINHIFKSGPGPC